MMRAECRPSGLAAGTEAFGSWTGRQLVQERLLTPVGERPMHVAPLD
jgi:hypothetical protein